MEEQILKCDNGYEIELIGEGEIFIRNEKDDYLAAIHIEHLVDLIQRGMRG